MQAQSSPRQASSLLSLVIAGLGVTLLLLLLLSFIAETRPPPTGEVAGVTTQRLAYLQFSATQDTLWLADPAAPHEREALLTIPHAAQYGAIPVVSPDRSRFAYTVLPPSVARPKPDSPAELWVVSVRGGEPQLLARDVDLLVRPVWSADGQSLVFRRSTDREHQLVLAALSGGPERVLAASNSTSLFPVGFSADGSTLYYTSLSEGEGTDLRSVELSTGEDHAVASLSNGLTRDWALSPDGTRLVFLDVALTETEVASRASVLDLETGALTPVTGPDEIALGPVWNDAGVLTLGVFVPASGDAFLLHLDGEARSRTDGPAIGFDVPLAYDATTRSYLVRAFENDSIAAPGGSTLVLVSPDGERTLIAEGETSLVGWTVP